MFYVNNNCKLDFKLGHVTHLITMFQPLLLLFVQNFKFLLMAYKVIRDLTPTDDFLEFISHRCDLCSLATATPAFCVILKHSKFIPTCCFLCLECGLPVICMTGPFLPFRSHLTCHLLWTHCVKCLSPPISFYYIILFYFLIHYMFPCLLLVLLI